MNFEIEESPLVLEKEIKKYEEWEIQLQEFEEEMYSTHSDLLRANRELKTDISGLEQTVSEANQIFNKITDQLKESLVTLEEKKKELEKLKATASTKANVKKINMDECLSQMDTKLKILNDSKVNFCIYKEIFG